MTAPANRSTPSSRREGGGDRRRAGGTVGRLRRRLLFAAGALLLLLALDWSRPPSRQWTVKLELAAIARYQSWVSPLLARAGARCRFTPSCSRYAAAVIARDGALQGSARALWRILRCAPWTAAGTNDPP